MQIGDQIYIRRSSAHLFTDVVHEGKHALDFLNGIVKKFTTWDLEFRAYFAEWEFQNKLGLPLDFESIKDIWFHIWENYPK